MPRQDVPYGGALCRLKERIAEIWDKLGEKLHSINGVEGDGQGNVKLVSGDAAITISEDQVNHTIEIGMDHGELPTAAVTSVNGQTGVVVLDATDIRTTNNTPIQTKITALEGATQTALNNINTEAQNRQAADNVLQGNINAVQASIPGAAAAAVANDPTVAQLVTDLAGKVDLTDVSTVETPDTIAKRNGSGRLVAADPASGATDKTLVTANWVSQTGDTGPNNLVHRSGIETVDGLKYINASFARGMQYYTDNHYNVIMDLGAAGVGCNIVFAVSGRYGFAIGGFSVDNSGVPTFYGSNTYLADRTTMGIGIKDGNMYLCGRRTNTAGQSVNVMILSATKGGNFITVSPTGVTSVVEMDSYTEGVKF